MFVEFFKCVVCGVCLSKFVCQFIWPLRMWCECVSHNVFESVYEVGARVKTMGFLNCVSYDVSNLLGAMKILVNHENICGFPEIVSGP